MRLLVVLLALLPLVLPPAQAAPGPLYFQRQYAWSGTTVGGVATSAFTVPATSQTLCYARLTVWDGSDHAASFKLVLTDGAGEVVVVDAGVAIHLPDEGVSHVAEPARPALALPAYEPGTFTLRFQAEGFHGNWIVQVYEVDSPADCGALPP